MSALRTEVEAYTLRHSMLMYSEGDIDTKGIRGRLLVGDILSGRETRCPLLTACVCERLSLPGKG